MESNSVGNHTSDKQNRTTAKWESDLLITSMITNKIGRHEVLLPINQNYVKIWERNQTSVSLKKKPKKWNARQQRAHITRSVHLHRHDVLPVPAMRYQCSALPIELTSQHTEEIIKYWNTEYWRIRGISVLCIKVQVNDDFRYMKFIYLYCGGEMKLRDPRS